jgi:hypothetical protein
LSGTAVELLPEPGIVGEAGTGGGKTSGEADVVAAYVGISQPGSWGGGATDAAPWMTSTSERHRGHAAQGQCWRLDRGVRGRAMMNSTGWWRRHEAVVGCEGVEVGVGVVRWVS